MMKSVPLNIAHVEEWIGKTEMRADVVSPTPIEALSATLDRDDALPQCLLLIRPGFLERLRIGVECQPAADHFGTSFRFTSAGNIHD